MWSVVENVLCTFEKTICSTFGDYVELYTCPSALLTVISLQFLIFLLIFFLLIFKFIDFILASVQ